MEKQGIINQLNGKLTKRQKKAAKQQPKAVYDDPYIKPGSIPIHSETNPPPEEVKPRQHCFICYRKDKGVYVQYAHSKEVIAVVMFDPKTEKLYVESACLA